MSIYWEERRKKEQTMKEKFEKQKKKENKEKEEKKIIYFFLFMIIFILLTINFIQAEIGFFGTFKKGSCINLKQTCYNDSISQCSFNKILEVIDPEGLTAISNISMVTSDKMTYTYNFCNATKIGTYIVQGVGDGDINEPNWNYDFSVTTTGNSSPNSIPLFFFLGGIIILIIAFIFKNEYFGLFSGFLFIVAGIYMMIYGLGIIADDYTRIIAYISLGLGIIICFTSVYEMFNGEGGNGLTEEGE